MRPSSADTSEPASTKRKMLSMKKRTSCPSSRNFSAIVRPETATRTRAPRGPFTCPSTSAGLSTTAARVHAVETAGQAVGGVHRDRAHPVVAEVLLHLCDELAVLAGDRDAQRVVDGGQRGAAEDGVDDHASDLDHLAGDRRRG